MNDYTTDQEHQLALEGEQRREDLMEYLLFGDEPVSNDHIDTSGSDDE